MHFEEELIHQLKELTMAITQLNADIVTLSTNVAALIAQGANSVPQSEVDSADAAVVALNATVVAALTPAASTSAPAASTPAARKQVLSEGNQPYRKGVMRMRCRLKKVTEGLIPYSLTTKSHRLGLEWLSSLRARTTHCRVSWTLAMSSGQKDIE